MRYYLVGLIVLVSIGLSSSAVFAKPKYHLIEIPDAVPAQYLTNAGQILGLDVTSGNAVLWSAESGITYIPAPVGYLWSRVTVSPGGRFLGAAFKPEEYIDVYYAGQLGSDLSKVVWPTSLPNIASQNGPSTGGAAGLRICAGPCPPDPPPPLPLPLPPRYFANAINDNGVIAGSVSINKSVGYLLGSHDIYAFRFYPNGQIEVMEEKGLGATNINNRGDALLKPIIMLSCGLAGNKYLWAANGQLLSPDPLSGYANLVRPILNDQGCIAGTATNEALQVIFGNSYSGNLQGFRWTSGTGTMALDQLSGFSNSIVHGLNSIGTVVGEATNRNRTCNSGLTVLDPGAAPEAAAVIWDIDGDVVDLNTVIDKSRKNRDFRVPLLTNAMAINDAGQILVVGTDRSGVIKNYLLSPRLERGRGVDKRHRSNDDDDSTNHEDEGHTRRGNNTEPRDF